MMRSSKRGAVTLPPAPAVSLFTTRYRDRVACAVLPEDPTDPARTRWSLPVAALLAAALVAAALVALLWPRGDHSPLDVIWAEDGAVFLSQALTTPLLHALFLPYGGYMQAGPRLIAAVAAALPLNFAAAWLALATALVRVGVAALVYRALAGHLPSRWVRLGLAAAVVLLPTANFEVLDNTANMHWLLFYAVLCVLLWRPVTRADHLIGGLVAAVGVASEPLALALLPVAVLGAWALPRRMYATVIGFAAGAVAQLTAMSSDHRATMRVAPIGQAVGAWLVRGPLTTLVGTTQATHLYQSHGYGPAIAATLVIVTAAVVSVRAGAPTRWLAVIALPLSIVIFAVIVHYDWIPQLAPSTPGVVFPGDRYNVLPDLLLLAVLAAGLQGAWSTMRGRFGRVVASAASACVLAAFTTGVVTTFALGSPRTQGIGWPHAFRAAQRECLLTGQGVSVPIQPPGWRVDLPCTRNRLP